MIDSHLHIWDLARGDYDWLAGEDRSLQRGFDLAGWADASAGTEVTHAVFVQAAPTAAESEFLLDVARQAADRVLAVVAWADLADPSAPQTIERYAADPLVAAVRPWLQAIPDVDWILGEHQARALDRMATEGLVYEALIRPSHLPAISRLVDRHPELTVVVDHGAKPDIASDSFDGWARDLRTLAEQSDRVFVKLSGLLTEAGERSYSAVRRYAEHVLESFGPERVLWGSDWPVVTTKATYREWFEFCRELVPAEWQDAVFETTALRAYGIGQPNRGQDRAASAESRSNR
jgi:L-fuconolactonase